MSQDTRMAHERVSPPGVLKTKVEKELWDQIVGAYAAEQFNEGDLPLLVVYVRTMMLADKSYRLLVKEGEVIYDERDRPTMNPRMKIWKDCCGTLASIATKLRIAPNARQPIEAVRHSSKRAKVSKVFDPSSSWKAHQVGDFDSSKLDG